MAAIFPHAKALTYPGSPPRKPGRDKFEYSENRTCACAPTYLLKLQHSSVREGRRYLKTEEITIADKEGNKKTKRSPVYLRISTDVLIKNLPPVDYSLACKLKPDYANHYETRVQLLWRQLLLVYRVGLEFSKSKRSPRAEGVVGTGIEGYQAAHSSTLPSLPYQLGEQEWIFAGNTSLGDGDATFLLPTEANKVDTSIDLYGKKLGCTPLREAALTILDAVSNQDGNTTPADGLRKFLKSALKVLRAQLKQSEKKSIGRMVVFQYRKVVLQYRKQLKDPSFFNKLCFVKGTLNQDGYVVLRDQMHGLISIEGERFLARATRKAKSKQNGMLTVQGKEYTIQVLLTPAIKRHSDTCLVAIKGAVQLYLTTSETFEGDLDKLKREKGFAQMKKMNFSQGMLGIINDCFSLITKGKEKARVQNLHAIVQWVLFSASTTK